MNKTIDEVYDMFITIEEGMINQYDEDINMVVEEENHFDMEDILFEDI